MLVFVIQILVAYLALQKVLIDQVENYVDIASQRIHDDIQFKNNKWDLSKYNSDPEVPGTYPVYILGSDGYVIDRWKPINGFLDTSDIKHLLTYSTPQTVSTITNQIWRIYSEPIEIHDQTLGIITVAIYNPQEDKTDEIDSRLKETSHYLQSKISIKNDTLDISKIDIRDVSYDISFQVVDSFNKIIAKNNNTNSIDRIPDFIDLSYIGNLLTKPRIQKISDGKTGEQFLFLISPFISNHKVLGITVVGRSISSIYAVLSDFLVIEIASGLIIYSLAFAAFYKVVMPQILGNPSRIREVKKISFDKKVGVLRFDNLKLQIPRNTNQYYMCESLFGSPKKSWESDILLDRFGEQDISAGRKVYDAMILINKRVLPILGVKLISKKDKTYRINPTLLKKIT